MKSWRPNTVVASVMAASAFSAAVCTATCAQAAEVAPPLSQEPLTVTRPGTTPSVSGPAQSFTGRVRIDMLKAAKQPLRASSAYVTFEPGARTFWHTHPVGQTLIVTAGAGRVQRWGSGAEVIRPGDVVWIPASVKHWHGAASTTGMTHIAITEAVDGKNVDWLEPVTEEQYAK